MDTFSYYRVLNGRVSASGIEAHDKEMTRHHRVAVLVSALSAPVLFSTITLCALDLLSRSDMSAPHYVTWLHLSLVRSSVRFLLLFCVNVPILVFLFTSADGARTYGKT